MSEEKQLFDDTVKFWSQSEEDEKRKNEHGLDIAPRFQEGNLKNFLSQSDES